MTKKTDKGRSRSLQRQVYFREPSQRFLVVCEGEKTEKIYFEAFKVPGDVRNIKVLGLGRNTVSLVSEAIRLKEDGDYNQVWCVFDVEEYSPDEVNTACTLAKRHGIRVACSNQAFEIWFLLHFDYCHTAIDRSRYSKLLSKKLVVCKTCFDG